VALKGKEVSDMTASDILFGTGVNCTTNAEWARLLGVTKPTIGRWKKNIFMMPVEYFVLAINIKGLREEDISKLHKALWRERNIARGRTA